MQWGYNKHKGHEQKSHDTNISSTKQYIIHPTGLDTPTPHFVCRMLWFQYASKLNLNYFKEVRTSAVSTVWYKNIFCYIMSSSPFSQWVSSHRMYPVHHKRGVCDKQRPNDSAKDFDQVEQDRWKKHNFLAKQPNPLDDHFATLPKTHTHTNMRVRNSELTIRKMW